MTYEKTLNPQITHFFDPVTGVSIERREQTSENFWNLFLRAMRSKAQMEVSLDNPKTVLKHSVRHNYNAIVSDRVIDIATGKAMFYAVYQDETIGEVFYDAEQANFIEIKRSETARIFYSKMKLYSLRVPLFTVLLIVSAVMFDSAEWNQKAMSLLLFAFNLYYFNYFHNQEIKDRLEYFKNNLKF